MSEPIDVTVNSIEFVITIDGAQHALKFVRSEKINELLKDSEPLGSFLVNLIGDLAAVMKDKRVREVLAEPKS